MGTIDWTLTRNQIIRQAMLKVGGVDSGQDPSAQEITDAANNLNAIVKRIAPRAERWPRTNETVTLTPGTESYTVGSGLDIDINQPINVTAAWRTDSDGNDIQIDVIGREEYMRLPTKDTESPAVKVYYHSGISNGILYVWPTGTSTEKTVIIEVQQQLEDFDQTSDTPDFPQNWFMALVWLLAEDLAPEYLGGIPGWLSQKALFYQQEAFENDTEFTSMQFQPAVRFR